MSRLMKGFALSSDIAAAPITAELAVACTKFCRRVEKHWRPYIDTSWWAPPIEVIWSGQTGGVPTDYDYCSIRIVEKLFDENLAEHSEELGRPICRLSWEAITKTGATLLGREGFAACATHEMAEAMLDPNCMRTTRDVTGKELNPNGAVEPLEVCDRVQGSDYEEDGSPGILVANVCTPAYYLGGPGPYTIAADLMLDPVTAPWEQLAGGYHEEGGKLVFGSRVSEAGMTRLLRVGPRGGLRRLRAPTSE